MTERTPGCEILSVIEAEATRLRDEAVAAAHARDEAAERLDFLAESREAVLTKLAELSLPDLDHRSIESTHAGVRQRLRELADRQKRSGEELAARQRRLEGELARRQQTVVDAANAANSATAAYDARREELEAFLNNDADYQAMKTACDQAQARLERDRGRLHEVEQDAEEKLPDYESSRLFMYLRDRKYQTPDYAAWGVAKSLDRWVARKIDYASLQDSYRFLTTVPSLMREELVKREAEVDDLVGQMLGAVKAAEGEFGMSPLEADAAEAAKVVARAESERDRTAEHVDTVVEQLAALRSRESRFYLEAIHELKRFLEGVESDVLARHAGRTETLDDDDAVAELRSCRLEADTAAATSQSATERAEAAAETADGLDYVLRRANQTDLGSERAHFATSFDVREPLRQFEKGVIDRARLLEILKDEAELDPTWAERAYQRGSDVVNSQSAQILMGTVAKAAEPLLREALRRR